MKARFFASIITGILASSVAQAESAFSPDDLNVIYSGLNPSFTRDLDISHYYLMPAQLQQAATKSVCHWRLAQNDSNSLNAVYNVQVQTAAGNSDYLAPVNLQLVC